MHKNFQSDLHEVFREGWQWASKQMIEFWWRSASPSRYMDCFPDSSLLGIRKVDINGHKSAVHTDLPDGSSDKTCLGIGMHCPRASTF